MKTAVSMPDDLFRAAERAAKRLGLSRSELYRRAIESFIRDHSEQAVTEALDRVHESQEGPGRLDHLLEQLQDASVPREEW